MGKPALREASLRRWNGLVAAASTLALGVFVLLASSAAARAESPRVQIRQSDDGRAYVFVEGNQPVLQYNYRTVPLPEGFLEKVRPNSRKYARPRSDYIHPLYGPDGEVLTDDFCVDHPHHRGIYWAWPEVKFGDELGDLHALQRVFARPTGQVKTHVEQNLAELTAESLWKWEDQKPIVRELATIRVHAAGPHGRFVDLTFQFTGLVDGVSIARRHTNLYGGLNTRLARAKPLKFVHHADPKDAQPQRAWSDAIGVFQGGKRSVGLAIFEKSTNPYYPGDWVVYEHLPWFQPTFPAAGVRYPLKPGQTLTLQYRLWIRPTEGTSDEEYRQRWDEYNGQ